MERYKDGQGLRGSIGPLWEARDGPTTLVLLSAALLSRDDSINHLKMVKI
jgi:hypothetical protein